MSMHSPLMIALLGAFGLSAGPTRGTELSPLDDCKKPGIMLDAGSPHAQLNPNGSWKIIVSTKYRYDPGWEFSELRIELYYIKKDEKATKSSAVINAGEESTIGIKGAFKGQFDMRAPVAGETITIKAVFVAKHPEFGEQQWSVSSPVLPPAK